MAIGPETVEEYLDAMDWQYRRAEGLEGVWLTRVGTEALGLDLQIRLNPHWLMIVGIYLRAEQVPESRREALRALLLELNHRFPLVKFGLDEDGDVRISTELPAADVSATQFRTALQMTTLVGLQCYRECLDVIMKEGPQ